MYRILSILPSINKVFYVVLKMYGECLIADKLLCINSVSDTSNGTWEELKKDCVCLCVCMQQC